MDNLNDVFKRIGEELEQIDNSNGKVKKDESEAYKSHTDISQRAAFKSEKYPNVDFTTQYFKGQIIYYVNIDKLTNEKELLELKLRTIYPKTLIGCTKKAYAQCIGPDTIDRVFEKRDDAVLYYNQVKANAVTESNDKDDTDEKKENLE